VVILDYFTSLAKAKRRQMGLEALEPVVVPGPLGAGEHAAGRGEMAMAGVVEWITRGSVSPSGEEAPVAGPASAPRAPARE
jgi:hypothetical protein